MFIFDTIFLILNSVNIPTGKIKATELKKRLSTLFKNIKISIEKSDTLSENDYAISGFYLEEFNKIQILLIISSKSKGYLNIENSDAFRFYLAQTIQHEYVHHSQYIKRNELSIDSFSLCFVGNAEQKYLGERDEIDAYSYDIALEVYNNGWNNSQTLKIYRKQFDITHPVMKRLLKKTYKNLEVLNERKNKRVNERNHGVCSQ